MIEALDVDAIAPTDAFPPEKERPCWRCYDNPVERGDRTYRAGVYWHDAKLKDDGNATLTDTWCCAPLRIEAMTADLEDCAHGRLLRYRSTSGRWKQWAMPMQMLAGDGTGVLEILLGEGLVVDRRNKAKVLDYISAQQPKKRLKSAATTGWHGNAFVLPDETIGDENDIWYQATERTAPYGTSGTLEGWRHGVAERAVGNPMLMLGICAAFAGVLLERLNMDGAGLHLYGDSSCGKTTTLVAATSVWGGSTFRRSWRVTSNGLEGAARMHTGTLLALDEVGECAPRDLYEAAYSLVNGHGKTRANIRGEARQAARWRVFVLSTGEHTIASRMATGGFDAKAGQGLRLLDVPMSGTYGGWDCLHGFSSGGTLADAIRDGAAQHYGHAGRAFVLALIEAAKKGRNVSGDLDDVIGQFQTVDGQEARAARIFAVCALAGEMASRSDVVPWERGEATAAALKGFALWRERRATSGRNAEDAAILRAVADFIDRHEDSRFSSMDYTGTVRERAGYLKQGTDGTIYLFTSHALREATPGYDIRRVSKALDSAGLLTKKDSEGKASPLVDIGGGEKRRLYHVDGNRLREAVTD